MSSAFKITLPGAAEAFVSAPMTTFLVSPAYGAKVRHLFVEVISMSPAPITFVPFSRVAQTVFWEVVFPVRTIFPPPVALMLSGFELVWFQAERPTLSELVELIVDPEMLIAVPVALVEMMFVATVPRV